MHVFWHLCDPLIAALLLQRVPAVQRPTLCVSSHETLEPAWRLPKALLSVAWTHWLGPRHYFTLCSQALHPTCFGKPFIRRLRSSSPPHHHTHHGEAHPTPQLSMSQGPLEASTWCNKHSTTILGSIFLGLIAPGSTHVSAGLQFWKNEVRIPFSLFSDYFTNGLKKLPSRWRRWMDELWSSGCILLWAYVSFFSFIFTFRQQLHCYNVVTELTVSNEPLLNRAHFSTSFSVSFKSFVKTPSGRNTYSGCSEYQQF